ncbi:LytR family transcriptional regulator [Corynebacterium sp. zg254]|uniref:LytR family transcriptional regulator n=1 Tax=Corynebacterium zhongnanshanii TaxID=2768834 RepID=A0ABQ6VEZ6_9CORY|nr:MULTISPECIES: LCP family protein [Corynebacterium]KAB3522789.1 LytR family transcriptional regulator [Corynebacterium zhongnanshanii]MCR5914148.1 LytR family transcriptional regulator [Corynebacterium sp. zg254]
MDSRNGYSGDSGDEFARDRNGKVIVDRFGRPVRRRAAPDPSPSARRPLPPNRSAPPRREQPEAPRYQRSAAQYPAREPVRAQPYEPTQHQQNDRAQHQQQGYQQASGPGVAGGRSEFSRPSRGAHAARTPLTQRLRVPGGFAGVRRGVGIMIIILLALVIGGGIWVDSNLQRTDAIQKYDGRPKGSFTSTNWLLVGSDSRAGLTAEDADRLMAGELDNTVNHTDTIMVVHVPLFGKATMMSIPRDSYVSIPGYGQDKINQAFAIGGAPLLQQTVEQSTGIHIDRYAEIGFGGFANVVDKMGGVNICVEEPLDDPMAGINLQAGCQDLDGPTALGYVRSRYASANGDLDRVARQRQFLNAMAHKMTSVGTLANPFRLFPTVKTLSNSLTVNQKDHVWNLAKLGLGMAGGVHQETVPVASYEDTDVGNVVLWDDAAAREMFKQFK